MKSSMSKNSFVKFLLFHSFFINLFLFPCLFVYSIFYSVDYLSLNEWVKSVCLNLISWQVVSYSLKNDMEGDTSLKLELKKFSILVGLNKLILKLLSHKRTRLILFNSLIWFAIVVNFFSPIVASLFFNFPLTKETIGLLFISFQLITLIVYYLNYYFPQDLPNSEKPLSSPWFIEVLIGGLSPMKLA